MLKRYATLLTAMILLWSAVLVSGTVSGTVTGTVTGTASEARPGSSASQAPQAQSTAGTSAYEGKVVQSIQIPGVADSDREHIRQLLPQKAGEPLDRSRVRDSIRALYATGRFADIQAEVSPSGEGVVLTFTTSANFFVGAVNVEGAPARPTPNQIVNASKLQLGELYTQEKLDRALENIRQLMQEGGYYRARVTAESSVERGHAAGGHPVPHHPG